MPISVSWDDPEHTILLITVNGPWTMDMYHEYYLQAHRLMQEERHPITMIIDMEKSVSPPDSFMSGMSLHRKYQSDNLVFATFVGASRFMMILTNIVLRLVPSKGKFLFSASLEEARALCQERLQSQHGA